MEEKGEGETVMCMTCWGSFLFKWKFF